MSDNILIKLKATADILGGDVFFADENGCDPNNISSSGLLPNGMYIKLEGSDGSFAYISAFELDKIINNLSTITATKANAADVTTLQQLLEGKASDTDIELIYTELDKKVDKTEFDTFNTTLSNKADNTVVDTLI